MRWRLRPPHGNTVRRRGGCWVGVMAAVGLIMLGSNTALLAAPVLLQTGQEVTGTTASLSMTAGGITKDGDLTLSNDGSGNLVVQIAASPSGADWWLQWSTSLDTATYKYAQIDFVSTSAGAVAGNWQVFWQDDDSGIGGVNNSGSSIGSVSPSTSAFSVVIDLSNGGTSTSGAKGWGPGTLDAFRFDFFEDVGNYGETFTISAVTLGSALTPMPAAIVFSDLSATAVTTSAATLGATVNTNLLSATVVWDTEDKGTNLLDWTGSDSLGPQSAGAVTPGSATGLNTDTLYTYRFYGTNATDIGWSSASTFATALSSAQTPVFTGSAAPSPVVVSLTWQDNASNETDYVLYRSSSGSSGPYDLVATVAADATSYEDAVAPSTTYYYRLAATNTVNGSGTDPSSCQSSAVTTPVAPAAAFFEDFENPDISADADGYAAGTTPSSWMRANVGYHSSYHGLIHTNSGTFATTEPGNEQAYAFRYTNTGITTKEGVIGVLVADGRTYTVSFDVVSDGTATPYHVYFLVFNDGAARNDISGDPVSAGSTLLKDVSGDAPSDGSYQTITFTYTPNPITDATKLGKDMAIRLDGATTTAHIDNVSVTDDSVPPPPPGTLIYMK